MESKRKQRAFGVLLFVELLEVTKEGEFGSVVHRHRSHQNRSS